MERPTSFSVYEFSYPEAMPELAGMIFYVGKGTRLTYMDDHLQEAALEQCACARCDTNPLSEIQRSRWLDGLKCRRSIVRRNADWYEAIRSVWAAGLAVKRNVVFTSSNERAVVHEERRRIIEHTSPYLTNYELPSPICLDDQYAASPQLGGSHGAEKGSGSSHLAAWANAVKRWAREAQAQQVEQNGALRVLSGQVLLS